MSLSFSTTQSDQWVGAASEIEAALEKAGAEVDDTGHFMIAGPQAPMLYGNELDVLITSDIFYFRGDQKFRLVDPLIADTRRRIPLNQVFS
jgi:hypothetical protein